MVASLPPFEEKDELCADLSETALAQQATLPGFPMMALKNAGEVTQFLHTDLVPEQLEAAASRLWIMTTQSSATIQPLHRQIISGRLIRISEDPGLHLVWSHDHIYIKPIPKYLLSYTIWAKSILLQGPTTTSTSDQQGLLIKKSALGLLRTYAYLIRHESDFAIAQRSEARLIPTDVSWPRFCRYMSEFRHILDSEVSARYYYGELRQSRLNLYAYILFRKLYYEREHWEYSDYFARFLAQFYLDLL